MVKKKNAKTQHDKGEPTTDNNWLTKDITKALRFRSNLDACVVRITLETFGVFQSPIVCTGIGDWIYLVADSSGGELLFIVDPNEENELTEEKSIEQ